MKMRFALLIAILSSFPIGSTAEEVYKFPASSWGDTDLSLSQSLVDGDESILGSSAKWEPLRTYPENTRERKWSRSVGRLEIRLGDSVGVCTAFLIGPDQLITNNHCVPGNSGPMRQASLVMGYYEYGSLETVKRYDVSITPEATSEGLDFSLLKVRGNPGDEWGWLRLATKRPEEGDRLVIIHHPAGQVKHITAQGCIAGPLAEGDSNTLLHRCDTVPGSSGSPIFNQDGMVVALHNAGTPLRGEGAFNFSKVATAINKAISEGASSQTDSVSVKDFKSLELEQIYEVYNVPELEVTEAYAADCDALMELRETWVVEDEIRYFSSQAEQCYERGAIAKFTFEKLKRKSERMSANFTEHNRSLSRQISCPSLISDIQSNNSKALISKWGFSQFAVSAYCGMTNEEEEVVRLSMTSKYPKLESFWGKLSSPNDLNEFTLISSGIQKKSNSNNMFLGLAWNDSGKEQVIVTSVLNTSKYAALAVGDRLLTVNDVKILNSEHFRILLTDVFRNEDAVKLVVFRGGRRLSFDI